MSITINPSYDLEEIVMDDELRDDELKELANQPPAYIPELFRIVEKKTKEKTVWLICYHDWIEPSDMLTFSNDLDEPKPMKWVERIVASFDTEQEAERHLLFRMGFKDFQKSLQEGEEYRKKMRDIEREFAHYKSNLLSIQDWGEGRVARFVPAKKRFN